MEKSWQSAGDHVREVFEIDRALDLHEAAYRQLLPAGRPPSLRRRATDIDAPGASAGR